MTTSQYAWWPLFQSAIDAQGGNKKAVAAEMGVSRTTVSLVASGKYPSPLDAFGTRVIETYDLVPCPALDQRIGRPTCRSYAYADAPTNSPREMRHWRLCQSCPNKPEKEA